MTERERTDKNTICDLLMNEGLDRFSDEEKVARTGVLTDLALELGRKDVLSCVLRWYEALHLKNLQGEQAILLDYNWANAIAAGRYGTQWKWEQSTLAREIYHLRRAASNSSFQTMDESFRCKCLNDLGSRLRVAGRAIEALDCWRRVLDSKPNFGMSLCNRAMVLASYAGGLEDDGKRALLLWAAHTEAEAALAHTAFYTDIRDEQTRKKTKELKEWVESFVDVKGITALDPLNEEVPSSNEDERRYRRWCLHHCLYLNVVNDVGPHACAAYDPLSLPGQVVPVDAPHTFESFFDQMKQEYVSARWLLYEGLTSQGPHFSDKEVLLGAPDPRPCLSLAVERIKAAYRMSYSLFDKVSFFLNAYMQLGIAERAVTFRTIWRCDDKQSIRKEFDQTTNWGFCALHWLSKDLFEKASDEVAEPQARQLSEIRNFLEHKYLRVTNIDAGVAPSEDLALMLSRQQFESKAIQLLKLARSALIYLAIGVRFEEQRRQPALANITLEELPPTARMVDEEKI